MTTIFHLLRALTGASRREARASERRYVTTRTAAYRAAAARHELP